jgi:hypothetical protein
MSPAPRPRTSGGFNQGIGHFNDSFDEHLDENAMQSAMMQKALSQQSSSSAQPGGGPSPLGAGLPGGAQPVAPREVGSLTEELVERPTQDIVAGLKSFFDINQLLDINPETDDPATQAKKKQMHSRWQTLDQEQQQVAQQRYKQEMEQKQREEQARQQAEQQRRAAEAQTLSVPSGPSKGPAGPGGQKKPVAVQRLEDNRKKLGGPQDVG